MKERIKMDLSGKDEVLLARVLGYRKSLFGLELFKNRPDHLSEERVDQVIGTYQEHYNAGKTGNRIEISLRNKARTEVIALFKSALHFLHCVATEDDIPLIEQAGFEVAHPYRKRTKKAPALALEGNG